MQDHKSLGLRVGLEIHQQLNSYHKLFCRCPIVKSEEFPQSVTRKLRPAAGELDVVDPAAIYEFLRNKQFVYRFNRESACLLELDEKPPDPINAKALETVLSISKMLEASIVDEVHVMRKTVIDGSAVSGFQRTALIATNGKMKTSFGGIGIATISLEEDASTPLAKGSGFVEYRLDRLGIPLIEIGTDADMHTPQEAKEGAEAIGTMLRSFPVVRGIGSIRQDVNISIEQGARVEIKGFQELEKIPQLVENEVERQVALLEIRDELQRRGLVSGHIRVPADVTKVFEKTDAGFIRKSLAEGGRVVGFVLPKFSGLLKKQCGDRTFGKELAGYAEAFGFGGIIHSDEDLAKYKLADEFTALRKTLGAEERDCVAILVGSDMNNLTKATNVLISRSFDCLNGVPEETRVADGMGSKYTRPLPGSGRLYPESDIPPVAIDRNYVSRLALPKTLDEIEKELRNEMPAEIAGQIIRSRYFPLFEEFRNFGPAFVASVFLSNYTDLRRRGFDVDRISKDSLFKVFSLVSRKDVSKDALPQILEEIARGNEAGSVLSKYMLLPEPEIEKIVRQVAAENRGKNESVIIGIAMSRLKGRADGKLVASMVRKVL